jgi:hypothetical protein
MGKIPLAQQDEYHGSRMVSREEEGKSITKDWRWRRGKRG